MATPGRGVVLSTGGRGVLSNGKAAVFPANGLCFSCCPFAFAPVVESWYAQGRTYQGFAQAHALCNAAAVETTFWTYDYRGEVRFDGYPRSHVINRGCFGYDVGDSEFLAIRLEWANFRWTDYNGVPYVKGRTVQIRYSWTPPLVGADFLAWPVFGEFETTLNSNGVVYFEGSSILAAPGGPRLFLGCVNKSDAQNDLPIVHPSAYLDRSVYGLVQGMLV